jgi:hypothetical protein
MLRTHSRFVLDPRSLALALGLALGTSACAGTGTHARTALARPTQTLAAAAAACSKMQQEQAIPVGCITRDIGGVPSMFIAFDRQATADLHLSHVASEVAGPFCDAANSSNRQASVYVAISTWAKRYNCELGQWGEWFSFNGNLASLVPNAGAQQTSRESGVAEAVARCRRVHENATIPVACKLQVINDVPSMVIGFRNQQEAAEFLRPMAENVAGPFCDAANDSGQPASVAVVVAKQTARLFDCAHGQWGEWFSLGGGEDESAASADISL